MEPRMKNIPDEKEAENTARAKSDPKPARAKSYGGARQDPIPALADIKVLDFSPSTEAGIIAGFLTIPVLGIGSAMLGLGEVGFLIAAVGATVVGIGGKVVVDKKGGEMQFSLPELNWDALFGTIGGQVVEGSVQSDLKTSTSAEAMADKEEDGEQTQASRTPAIDALFHQARVGVETTAIPRLMPNDIVRNTQPDSFQVCIGRSLTRLGNPPIWINFYGQHLKVIGASQYGKSSMAACILYLITRTHSPRNVLIALLDLEHKTSKLFTDCQHVAEVNIDGTWVTLHAKDKPQVLEHLGYVVAIMDERYALSEEEVEQEPILLVYLEEFLALKDYYKRLVDSTSGDAKEIAKKDFSQLVFRVSEIARRGLKVKVQFLLCAQVDYRDEDFQEALVNITGGMSFNVRSSAAQAAGFVRTDLLKRNEKDDKRGQAVVETPDCKDLVLAPEYNLKKKLLALDKARQAANPLPQVKRPSMLVAVNSRKTEARDLPAARQEVVTDELDEQQLAFVQQTAQATPPQLRLVVNRNEQEEDPQQARMTPILPEKGRRAEDIDLNAAIAVYNAGNHSRYQLAKIFDLSESQGRKLKEIIEQVGGRVGR